MSIIVHNADVQADVALKDGRLSIDFADPAFVRCDTVLVDILQRTIGVVLHEGYHKIGMLPESIPSDDLKQVSIARVSGLVGGESLSMRAPIRFSKCA